jgi:hypothetical protein
MDNRHVAAAVIAYSSWVTIIVLGAAFARPAMAEDVCWRGRPSAACRYFLITEFGLGGNLSTPADPARADHVSTEMLIYDLGFMTNIGGGSAIGATISFKAMYETRLGFFGRYRRWLGGEWSLDLSPGIILIGSSNDGDYALEYPAAGGRVTIGYGDWIGAGIGMELVRVRDGDTEIDWYADAHLGYYPGAVLAVLVTVLGLLVASSMAVPP